MVPKSMNLERSLSRHQLYYLKEICSGQMVLEWSDYFQRFGIEYRSRDGKRSYGLRLMGDSKPRGRQLVMAGGHLDSSIIELRQRGLLVEQNGRLMPSKEAAKQFGSPPPLVAPKREIAMSRTRAAREQPKACEE